jgi:hypothetical protein
LENLAGQEQRQHPDIALPGFWHHSFGNGFERIDFLKINIMLQLSHLTG